MLRDSLGEGCVNCFPRKLGLGPVGKVSGNFVMIDTKAVTNKDFDVRVGFNLFIEVVGDSVLGFGFDSASSCSVCLSVVYVVAKKKFNMC